MTITAGLVKELRERTGAGMMECKKALEEAKGDIEKAIELMRKSGQAKAREKSTRIAAEGVVAIKISTDRKKAFMVEVNCETDFVARDSGFSNFVVAVVNAGLVNEAVNLDQLLALVLADGQTLLKARENLIAKIGENIKIRRIKTIHAAVQSYLASYLHSNGRIGVLVEITAADPNLGKEIAMHIAASKPLAILPKELPEELLQKEKEIYIAELADSGKPAAICEKIVVGKLQKFISELTLINQPFVKDPEITIEKLLERFNAQVNSFIRFEVGEGVEKKESDFAAEVQAQIKSTT